MITNTVKFWILLIIALLFLGMGILSFLRALQGGGSIQYIIVACMGVGFLLFAFVAVANKRGKWPWE